MKTKTNSKKLYSKVIKLILYPIITLVIISLIYFLAAFILSRIPVNTSTSSLPKPINIYIISNGFHSDIVVPIKSDIFDWSKIIKYDHITSKDTSYKYIAFGWGDKKFYINTPLWSDLKFDIALQALFCLNPSAIHVTFFRIMFESESCIKIPMSKPDYLKLIEYIKNDLKFDKNGQVQLIKNLHYDDNDAFYESNGSFTLFYTCNTWVNEALKYSNQKACFWTPFESGIFYQYSN